MTFAAIAKGLATHVVPRGWINRSHGRTLSARYCYSVYLRHMIQLHEAGAATDPKAVAEIGPGASIGTGLATLIGGAERYFGFDIKAYAIEARNLVLFDELIALFQTRAPVPGYDEFPSIKPALGSDAFPEHIFTPGRLARVLEPSRLAMLRAAIAQASVSGPSRVISYVTPWFATTERRPESIDWIFSQAVMEHVDDLLATYSACYAWLKPGGVTSHQVDFKSHGTAPEWNGHWAYSDLTWRMVRGARLYLINRAPYSAHLDALRSSGLECLMTLPVMRDDGLPRARLASPFSALSDEDVRTAGAFFIARRPPADMAAKNVA